MLLDVGVMAVFLAVGNVVFRHFDPFVPLWRRLLKIALILMVTAGISYFFGRRGVLAAFVLVSVPLVYVHGVWLPRHGVNGWTGEPKEKYYALRGWPPPADR